MDDFQSFTDHLTRLRQIIDQMVESVNGDLQEDAREAQARLALLLHAIPQKSEQPRLATLYAVSRSLGASLDLEEALNQVMDAVIQLTGAERGFIMLVDPLTSQLSLSIARNFQHQNLEKEERQISRSVIDEALRSGEGLLTSNAQTDARFSDKDSILQYALRSILCVPLRVRQDVIGVIYVDNPAKSGLFEPDDLQLLNALANQAAVAIENARLYSQIDAALGERVAELETLQKIDRELNTGLDQEQVLDLTLKWAIRGANAENGWIALRPDDQPTLTVVSGVGKGAQFRFMKDTDLHSLYPETEDLQSLKRDPSLKALSVPVKIEAEMIALITIYRQGNAFQPNEISFVERLAEHAAIAIENTRLYRSAQAANLAKSHFITLVSHELRIPMTAICGYADLIQQGSAGPVSDQQDEFLQTIRKNVDRMEALVSDLSDISRLETGRLQFSTLAFPLSKLIHETVENLMPQFEAKGQAVQFEIPVGLPQVKADPDRAQQILTNFLSNAQKYTPSKGKITLRAEAEKGCVRTSVVDNGIGIRRADQADLFSQFFRSDDPAVRKHQGWGMGLHVAQQLVRGMGGEIGFISEYGKGSTFWFTLPIAQQTSKESGDVQT